MTEKTAAVSVHLLDKEYLVACPEDEQDGLLTSARYLSGRMKEIRDSGKVVGMDRIAVMAALNITHELLQQQAHRNHYGRNFGVRIRALRDKVEEALNHGRQLDL
ncbi:MAG: cell division protein ZapA [Chromatiales bacterium 21-64-14]|nr:MAG: cell division protein ZapA [Chromatiales bacterium 21-64-14]HQU16846.1 cell division protein ZapA [Gammaproteobacteria bacterium]